MDLLEKTLAAIAEALKEPVERRRDDKVPQRTGRDAIDARNDHARDLRKHD